MKLSNAALMKLADQRAIAGGIPSTVLMERAASYLAEEAERHLQPGTGIVIFCGSGNNGGDGIACAAILQKKGIPCSVFLVGRRESMTADSLAMEQDLRSSGGILLDYASSQDSAIEALQHCSVIIDALFGIGLNREIHGDAACVIEKINSSGAYIISADIASGVSADSGQIFGCAVKADCTVTFSMAKPGHFAEPGCECCGALHVCSIGIPESLLKEAACPVEAVLPEEVTLPKRPALSHKGDYGKIGIIAGSTSYSGAPNLCSRACVRAGAGLVYLAVPETVYTVCAIKNNEAMVLPLMQKDGCISKDSLSALQAHLSSWDVLAAGPGLGRTEETRIAVKTLLSLWDKPLVLDADALWAVSDEPEVLLHSKANIVLTPHTGEFQRLYPAMSGNRLQDAASFAEKYRCTLVLKGHRTVIALPDGRSYLINAGNPGMAKGGCGDVLTGIIAAMLGQLPFEKAVLNACMLHSMAGDSCAERLGEYGMLPSDMIEELPKVMRAVTKK